MKKWLGMGIVGALLILLVVSFLSKGREPTVAVSEGRIMQATNFELPTLDGTTLDLHSQQGKMVVLNFWASWCQPCIQEAPHLQAFYEANKQGVEILAVNITKKDDVKAVQEFVDDFQLTFPILLDEGGEVSTVYGAFAIPTTIILNRDGVIVKQISGPVDEAYLQELVANAE